jgi:lipopolysaccharide export system permease protein
LTLTRVGRVFTIHGMYILTRHVVWEVLKYFLAALVALTLIFTLVLGVQEGMSWGAPPLVMLRIMPYVLPETLGITIPVAILYSVSNVFGRMTGSNEIVAIKSLGISPMAVVWPALVLAAFLSLGTIWMYELAATWCRPNRIQTFCESLEEIAYGALRTNKHLSDDRLPLSITVTKVDGRKLVGVTIKLKDPPTTLTASEAELQTDRSDPAAPVLRLIVTRSTLETSMGTLTNSGTVSYPVSIVAPPPDRTHRDWIAMKDIPTVLDELAARRAERQTALRQLEDLREASRSLGMKQSAAESAKEAAAIGRKRAEIDEINIKIFRLQTESFRRWSNGFTCLCFAMLGIPVAMLWRHADGLTNFFVCFLPILVIYYPLLRLSEQLSTSGTLPPISFWISNVVLAAPAVALLRWVNQH